MQFPLSDRQKEIFEFIRGEVSIGKPPTLHEIAERFCLNSSQSALHYVRRLVEHGLITRKFKEPRGIEVTEAGRKFGKALPWDDPETRARAERPQCPEDLLFVIDSNSLGLGARSPKFAIPVSELTEGVLPKRDLLTTEEVAAYLQMAPATMHQWRVIGDGPKFVRVGGEKRGKLLYRRTDVEAWIESRCFEHTGQADAAFRDRLWSKVGK